MSSASASETAIAAGSIADLARLYCPEHARQSIEVLLVLEAEIRTSARSGLDHAIAHIRLEWWQGEAERTLAGTPAHPLTRALCAALAPESADLRPLLQSVRLELAGMSGADSDHWRAFYEGSLGTVFTLLGRVLDREAPADALRTLGGAVQQLSTERDALPAQLEPALATLNAAQQRKMRPLLVWAALVGWRVARRIEIADERPLPGFRLSLAQQWRAWRAARAAEAGTFRWLWLQRPTKFDEKRPEKKDVPG